MRAGNSETGAAYFLHESRLEQASIRAHGRVAGELPEISFLKARPSDAMARTILEVGTGQRTKRTFEHLPPSSFHGPRTYRVAGKAQGLAGPSRGIFPPGRPVFLGEGGSARG